MGTQESLESLKRQNTHTIDCAIYLVAARRITYRYSFIAYVRINVHTGGSFYQSSVALYADACTAISTNRAPLEKLAAAVGFIRFTSSKVSSTLCKASWSIG